MYTTNVQVIFNATTATINNKGKVGTTDNLHTYFYAKALKSNYIYSLRVCIKIQQMTKKIPYIAYPCEAN